MKKIILASSTLLIVTPVISVISCGVDEKDKKLNFAISLLQREVLFGKTNTKDSARQVKYSKEEDAIYNDLLLEQISEKLNNNDSFIELKDSSDDVEWWENKDMLRDVLFLTSSSIPSVKAFGGATLSYRIDLETDVDTNVVNVHTKIKVSYGGKSIILNYHNFGIADSMQSNVNTWARAIQKSFAYKTSLITLKTESEFELLQADSLSLFDENVVRSFQLIGHLDYSLNEEYTDVKTEYTLTKNGLFWTLDIIVSNKLDTSKNRNLPDITIRQRNTDELIQGIETDISADIKSQQNGKEYISSAKVASAIAPVPTSNIQSDLGLRPSFKVILDRYSLFGVEATYTSTKKTGLSGAKYVIFLNLSKEHAQRTVIFNLQSLDYVSPTGQEDLNTLMDSLSFTTPSFTNAKLSSLQTTEDTIFDDDAIDALGLIGNLPNNPNGFKLTYTFAIAPNAINGQVANYILTIKGGAMGLDSKTKEFIYTSSDLYENDTLIVQTVKDSIIAMYGAEFSTLTSRSVANDMNVNSNGTVADFESTFDFGKTIETIASLNSIITWTYAGGANPTIEISIVKNEASAQIYYRVAFHANWKGNNE